MYQASPVTLFKGPQNLTAGKILAMAYMEKEHPFNMMTNNLCCNRITEKFGGGGKNRETESDYQDTEFRVMQYF
jgi:hypothetical protein